MANENLDTFVEAAIHREYLKSMKMVAKIMQNHIDADELTIEQRDKISEAVMHIFELGGLSGIEIEMDIHRVVFHKHEAPEE